MAELVMTDLVYPPAQRKLAEHGVSYGRHVARQLVSNDYEEYDLLIEMDKANMRNMYRICGVDFASKVHLFSFWIILITLEMSPIHGTPKILRPPGGMYWLGDRDCSAF